MLRIRMQLKYFLPIIGILILWNLFPSLASSAPNYATPYISHTAKQIVENNKLTNKFQNELELLHTEDYFNEVSKNLDTYYTILMPPSTIYDYTQQDEFERDLISKCSKEYKIIDTDFYNLSSVCLKVLLEKNLKQYAIGFDSSANSETQSFLLNKVKEANNAAVEFYTETYSAYIIHKQYEDIKMELEEINDRLYDVLIETKYYPIKLPNATTTSCT